MVILFGPPHGLRSRKTVSISTARRTSLFSGLLISTTVPVSMIPQLPAGMLSTLGPKSKVLNFIFNACFEE